MSISKKLFLVFSLAICAKARAQSVISSDPADYNIIAGKSWLFYIKNNGTDFVKTFTCAPQVKIGSTPLSIECQGGIGESWTAYYHKSSAISDLGWYSIVHEDAAGLVAANTYFYLIKLDGGVRTGFYAKHLGFNETTEPVPAHVRNFTVAKPMYSETGYFTSYLPDPLKISLDYPTPQTYDAKSGTLNIESVIVGPQEYRATMKQVPSATGLTFQVISATPK